MKVGFIGFGNMAQALAEGFAATGALKPCQIGACARDRAKLRRNTEPKGFLAFDDAARVAEFADMVIVAVKPHQVEAVLSPVKELLAGKIVVSVAAGMTFGKYETILAPGTHHLSTVPNTPVAVGERFDEHRHERGTAAADRPGKSQQGSIDLHHQPDVRKQPLRLFPLGIGERV